MLYAWQALFVKPVPKPAPARRATPSHGGHDRGEPAPRRRGTGAASAGAGSARPAPAAATLVGDTAERDVRVETRDVIAVFTNRGARLKSWRLKHYLDQQTSSRWSSSPARCRDAAAAVLRCAPRRGDDRDAERRPVSRVSGAPARRGDSCAGRSAVRVSRHAPAFTRVKEFHLEPSSYIIGFTASVTRERPAAAADGHWGPALGDVTASRAATSRRPKASRSADGKVHAAGAEGHRQAADLRRRLPLRRRRRPLLHDRRAASRASRRSRYQPVTIPPPPSSKDAARDLRRRTPSSRARRRAAEVLRRPEGLRRARARSIAISSARSTSACSPSSSCRCCGR